MSAPACLQAVPLHEVKAKQEKTLWTPSLKEPAEWTHHGLTLTSEAVEPGHQPGHGSRREFRDQGLRHVPLCWLTPVRGRYGSSFCCPGLLNTAFTIRQHPSAQHSSSKSLLHPHGIELSCFWKITLTLLLALIPAHFSEIIASLTSNPGKTSLCTSSCLWFWNLNRKLLTFKKFLHWAG